MPAGMPWTAWARPPFLSWTHSQGPQRAQERPLNRSATMLPPPATLHGPHEDVRMICGCVERVPVLWLAQSFLAWSLWQFLFFETLLPGSREVSYSQMSVTHLF